MKKLLSFALVLLFAFISVASVLSVSADMKGDVNNNGEIDSQDYLLTKRAYFGTYRLDDGEFLRADVNGSNEIDSQDYALIKRAYFGTYKFTDDTEIPSDSSVTTDDPSSEAVGSSSEIPDESSEIPDESSEIPDESSEIPDESSEIPDESSEIPDESSEVTPPEPSPEEILRQKAAAYVAEMSDYEKICQLFVVTPESITGVTTQTQAGTATQTAIEKYPVGGIILFGKNVVNESQLSAMTSNMAKYGKTPLLISTDEEGGAVARLGKNLSSVENLNPMYTYRAEGASKATSNAEYIARYLKKYGINTDFAPVADVWSNPVNTVIGTRAYSDNFTEAATLVEAAVTGFNNEDMICTLKHFPGHGDTVQDSHNELAHVTKSLAELEAEEFTTFKAGIDAGADMVMVGHLVIDCLEDSRPATLNPTVVTGMLRNGLGFDGVIITDSMAMGAIVNNYGTGNAAVLALQAGVDILLMPDNLSNAISGIQTALSEGTLTWERVDESVTRIIKMKMENNIISID